jgi:TPR repeat protein
MPSGKCLVRNLFLCFSIMFALATTAQADDHDVACGRVLALVRALPLPLVHIQGYTGAGPAFYKCGDYEEAARWYKLAAKAGHWDDRLALGLMYALGKGVPKDHVLAMMWLQLAGGSGEVINPRAQVALGLLEQHVTPEEAEEARRLASLWPDQ